MKLELDKIHNELKEIYNYMSLNQKIEKCDLIIGCGCTNLNIPKLCSKLYKEGYAPKVLFCGGYGKVTQDIFKKSEAELYKEIALKEGVKEKDILVENRSKNTYENFLFTKELIKENNLEVNSILIVHRKSYERRTLNTARKIFKDKKLMITSEDISFAEYFESLKKKDEKEIYIIISVLVANIQRMIIYSELGFQIQEEVPKNIITDYFKLKKLGYNRYIISLEEFNLIAKENNLAGKIHYFG